MREASPEHRMTGPTSAVDPWVRCSHPAPEAPARMVCFTTAGLLNEPALRRTVLPAIRADHQARLPLDCPITAVSGDRDPLVEAADLDGRREHTTAAFRTVVLPDDHFHPVARQEAVRDVLLGTLRRLEVGR